MASPYPLSFDQVMFDSAIISIPLALQPSQITLTAVPDGDETRTLQSMLMHSLLRWRAMCCERYQQGSKIWVIDEMKIGGKPEVRREWVSAPGTKHELCCTK